MTEPNQLAIQRQMTNRNQITDSLLDRDQFESDKPFKWNWMMRYCKLHKLAPANQAHWEQAERAFIHAHGNQ